MTAEEGGVCPIEERLELADDAAFDAADIGDERAGSEGEAGELRGERGHDFDRGGEDDQGGSGGGLGEVGGGGVGEVVEPDVVDGILTAAPEGDVGSGSVGFSRER